MARKETERQTTNKHITETNTKRREINRKKQRRHANTQRWAETDTRRYTPLVIGAVIEIDIDRKRDTSERNREDMLTHRDGQRQIQRDIHRWS